MERHDPWTQQSERCAANRDVQPMVPAPARGSPPTDDKSSRLEKTVGMGPHKEEAHLPVQNASAHPESKRSYRVPDDLLVLDEVHSWMPVPMLYVLFAPDVVHDRIFLARMWLAWERIHEALFVHVCLCIFGACLFVSTACHACIHTYTHTLIFLITRTWSQACYHFTTAAGGIHIALYVSH